ncbi:MAG: hypothetical protein QXK94_02175 [Candidatus Jordarchaeales archaeon]
MADRNDIGTIKYIIKAKIEVNGVVEKPDVIGAIFGQLRGAGRGSRRQIGGASRI